MQELSENMLNNEKLKRLSSICKGRNTDKGQNNVTVSALFKTT